MQEDPGLHVRADDDVTVCRCRWDIIVFFMCHCLAWFLSDYVQLTGVQVILAASSSSSGWSRKGFYSGRC